VVTASIIRAIRRPFYNKELRNDYILSLKLTYYEKIKHDESGRHVARMGDMRSAYSILVEAPEGKKSLGKTKRRLQNNRKTNLKETGVRMWTVSGRWRQCPVKGYCEHGNKPSIT
jgi:hypothetical protein